MSKEYVIIARKAMMRKKIMNKSVRTLLVVGALLFSLLLNGCFTIEISPKTKETATIETTAVAETTVENQVEPLLQVLNTEFEPIGYFTYNEESEWFEMTITDDSFKTLLLETYINKGSTRWDDLTEVSQEMSAMVDKHVPGSTLVIMSPFEEGGIIAGFIQGYTAYDIMKEGG